MLYEVNASLLEVLHKINSDIPDSGYFSQVEGGYNICGIHS